MHKQKCNSLIFSLFLDSVNRKEKNKPDVMIKIRTIRH